MIIGISGYKRVGKDTAAFPLVSMGFTKHAYADPLKDAVTALFGIPRAHLEDERKDLVHPYWQASPRQLMQVLGTEAIRGTMREILPQIGNVHIRRMQQRYEQIQTKATGNMVVTDVRFPDEAAAIHDLGGCVIRISRPGYGPGEHGSESQIEDIPFDFHVMNDGAISDLYRNMVDVLVDIAAGLVPARAEMV